MSRAIKRICSDITKLHKSNIKDHGIYFHYNEEDVFTMKAMMIGPEGTPYFGGAYFFDIKFPKTYPLQPPIVKTMTQGNNTRFNPNLYTCGKVCLSMLNTWSGPGWTPCNSIESVLLSIQAMVLVKDPLKNEPGYETASKSTLGAYASIIRFENIRVSIINMFKNPPSGFEIFKNDFLIEFANRYSKILDIVYTYSKKQDGKVINSTYNMSRTINYKSLIPKLIDILGESMKLSYPGIFEKNKSFDKIIESSHEKQSLDSVLQISNETIKMMQDVVGKVDAENLTKANEDKPVKVVSSENEDGLILSQAGPTKSIETDDTFSWYEEGMFIVNNKEEAIEYFEIELAKKQSLLNLRKICNKYVIPVKKKSKRTGNMIWKKKKEMRDDIEYLLNKLKE